MWIFEKIKSNKPVRHGDYMGEYDTVIFDVGGTLLTSNRLFFEIAKRLRADNPEAINSFFGERFGHYYRTESKISFMTITECMAKALTDTSRKFNVNDISNESHNLYRWGFVTQGKAYPETREVLEELKHRGVRMIIATDADSEIMLEELEHFNIKDYFENIIISDEIRAYKPDPIFIEEIKKHVRFPERALFVGDSDCDVLTGRLLGATPLLIDRKRQKKSSEIIIISSLTQIMDVLDGKTS
jgi:FMN phosphatase YigB (HAD superfamily)